MSTYEVVLRGGPMDGQIRVQPDRSAMPVYVYVPEGDSTSGWLGSYEMTDELSEQAAYVMRWKPRAS